jgi:hypothetical protein
METRFPKHEYWLLEPDLYSKRRYATPTASPLDRTMREFNAEILEFFEMKEKFHS